MQQAQGAGTVPVLQTRIRTGFLTKMIEFSESSFFLSEFMRQQAQGAGTVPVLQTRTGFLTRHDLCLGEFFLIIRMYEAASTRSWHRASSQDAHRMFDEARLISRRVLSFHQIL